MSLYQKCFLRVCYNSNFMLISSKAQNYQNISQICRTIAKTDKSKALHHIVKDIDDSDLSVNPNDCMIIQDGDALFHSLQEISPSFVDIAHKLLSSNILYVCKRPRIQGCESKKPGQTFSVFYCLQGIAILFQTGKGAKRRCINVPELSETCTTLPALLGLHGFTGRDSTSAFRGKGKVKPMKLC